MAVLKSGHSSSATVKCCSKKARVRSGSCHSYAHRQRMKTCSRTLRSSQSRLARQWGQVIGIPRASSPSGWGTARMVVGRWAFSLWRRLISVVPFVR